MIRQLTSLMIALAIVLSSGPALANGRADYVPTLDRALRVHIQKRLKEEGFYRGPLNGTFGPQSQQALVTYRAAKNLMETTGDYVTEGGEIIKGDPLTFYLTPKLIKSLLKIDIDSDGEISSEQQRELLRQIRSGRPQRAPSPRD